MRWSFGAGFLKYDKLCICFVSFALFRFLRFLFLLSLSAVAHYFYWFIRFWGICRFFGSKCPTRMRSAFTLLSGNYLLILSFIMLSADGSTVHIQDDTKRTRRWNITSLTIWRSCRIRFVLQILFLCLVMWLDDRWPRVPGLGIIPPVLLLFLTRTAQF